MANTRYAKADVLDTFPKMRYVSLAQCYIQSSPASHSHIDVLLYCCIAGSCTHSFKRALVMPVVPTCVYVGPFAQKSCSENHSPKRHAITAAPPFHTCASSFSSCRCLTLFVFCGTLRRWCVCACVRVWVAVCVFWGGWLGWWGMQERRLELPS